MAGEAGARVRVAQVRGVQVRLGDEDVAGGRAGGEEGAGRLEDLRGGAELGVVVGCCFGERGEPMRGGVLFSV